MRLRPFVLRAAGATAALALAACWPSPNQNPDRTSYNPSEDTITQATVADLAESWVAPVDEGSAGTPVLSTNAVHVVAGPWAYAFDTRTGARRWKSSAVGDASVHGLVSVVSPSAFVRNGELMTSGGAPFPVGGAWWTTYLDVKTGTIVRTGQPEGLVDSVREPNTGGTFQAVRTDDRPEETLIVGGSGGTRARLYYDWGQISNSVVVGPDAVYATGSSLVPPITTVESPFGPIDLWAGFGHGVRRFPKDVSEGCTTEAFLNIGLGFACPDWVATLDGTLATAPVLNPGGQELYVTTAGGNLYALDRATGSVLWSSALGSAGGEPALAEGRLYVPTASNGLQVFDAAGCGAATCTPDWTTAEGGIPSVAGDVLYLGGPTVRAYPAAGCGAATCGPLWSADAGGTAGKVVVTGGRAYVGVTGRGVVSYSLPH